MLPIRLYCVLLPMAASGFASGVRATPSVQEPQPLLERVDALAKEVEASGVAVGFVIGMYLDETTFVRGYGETAIGSKRTPNGATLYEIGSLTKIFTGLLLADAVTTGTVSLEDPVNMFLPSPVQLPSFEEELADGNILHPVRLRHLATHTAALPRMPGNFKPADPTRPYEDYDLELLYSGLVKWKPPRSPGRSYSYSNLGAALLGHLLELAHDRPYAELLRSRIFIPLDLTNTVLVPDEDQRARLASPYDADLQPAAEWNFSVLAPCGALRSTADDMLTFMRACLDEPGAGDSPTHLQAALRLARQECFDGGPDRPGGQRMSLGWHLLPGEEVLFHNGRTGGYSSSIVVDLKRRTGLIFMTNSPGTEVGVLATQIHSLLRGEEPPPNKLKIAVELGTEVLGRYVGKYHFGPFQDLEITRDGAHLLARMTMQPAVRIYPENETEFFYRAVEARLVFELDEEGSPLSLTLLQNGLRLQAKRLE
ncbi:MAG TPA: serine hydrolase [Planctomycetota bacterium]|nr:serine hydrolase [Planctomycetota bacterium]